ncbi:hypothetical protein BWI96_06380 [Siphonobacter sp. SORGH_AS_0500]|uniref:hypothetical protein n=1 Tax=Siphonobacter sp. SORGH_AS_0500 TaxID=1864824 RepID=UPI000CBFDBA5|nr:hypothetical protein [Siphonobacter sp. SORGH_AS_0500]PKK37489.1 hypothetical protein BWI96_06380 [Siphonobacter sp. SORGH_AS_0500]
MKNLLITALLSGLSVTSYAQHEHHQMQADTTKPNHEMSHEGMNHEHHEGHPSMTHSYSLSLPMNRNGSGTGWQPDATPLYAWMKHQSKWMYMVHGSVFLRYTGQNINNPGKRGQASRLSAPNWVMGMAQRPVGKNGLFTASLMVSLDRLTEGGGGYPLLYQTGESWKGSPLIDRQHPHDLISGLTVGYTQRLSAKVDISGYVGYPGEPALGPVAFMHRFSSMNNPDATLSHHWQDATHITFGVATLGVRIGQVKLEGSSFTGREPNENRYNFDRPRFDSYSYRVSWNPSMHWSLQASRAYIHSPEGLHPEENVNRTTASVQHVIPAGKNSWVASTASWGYNQSGDHHNEHSALVESNWQHETWAVYGRYEFVQKSAEELVLPTSLIYNVNALSLGYNHQVAQMGKLWLVAGVQGTVFLQDKALNSLYGSTPLAGQVYLRLMPTRLKM